MVIHYFNVVCVTRRRLIDLGIRHSFNPSEAYAVLIIDAYAMLSCTIALQ